MSKNIYKLFRSVGLPMAFEVLCGLYVFEVPPEFWACIEFEEVLVYRGCLALSGIGLFKVWFVCSLAVSFKGLCIFSVWVIWSV